MILIFLVFFSCEKVITVDLNEANPNIVIEGILNGSEGTLKVAVSRTGSYFDAYSVQMVSGASVTFSDELGNQFIPAETGNGIYEVSEIFVNQGLTYTLEVEVEGTTYEGESVLNDPVEIDSLNAEYFDGFGFLDPGYLIHCFFQDPEGLDNFYRIKLYVNGVYQDSPDFYYVLNDEFFNGNRVDIRLQGQLFNIADTVVARLMAIDKSTYEYFNSLQDIIGSSSAGTAAPANPVTNLSNGALGYFSAFTIHSDTIIIQ